MSELSDYEIITFQRKPGLWRASITPKRRPMDADMHGVLTTEDSNSEQDALREAHTAIRKMNR
jgi:hypothetical protein